MGDRAIDLFISRVDTNLHLIWSQLPLGRLACYPPPAPDACPIPSACCPTTLLSATRTHRKLTAPPSSCRFSRHPSLFV